MARVNRYRKEMVYPIRMTYEACYHISGRFSKEEGKIPFYGIHYWINSRNKTKRYKGTIYLNIK